MNTIQLDKEKVSLLAVGASAGLVAGVLLTKYFTNSSSSRAANQSTSDEHQESMSLIDTPRSMDSSASFPFQPAASRFSHADKSLAGSAMTNGDSSSLADVKLCLIVRLDLAMSVGELAKHCCTAGIGQYKKLYKIRAPELKHWEKGAMKKDCYGVNSEAELIKVREAARQQGFATRGVLDGEERLVLLAVGPGPGANLQKLLRGTAQLLQ